MEAGVPVLGGHISFLLNEHLYSFVDTKAVFAV
jgi:hypothetical protein